MRGCKRVCAAQLYGKLAEHSLPREQECLLKRSSSRGARATRKQQLAHALRLERAGLPVDPHLGLHKQPSQAAHGSMEGSGSLQAPAVTHTSHAAECGADQLGHKRKVPEPAAAEVELEENLEGDSETTAQAADLSADDDGALQRGAVMQGQEISSCLDDTAADQGQAAKRQKLDGGGQQTAHVATGVHAGGMEPTDAALRSAAQQSKIELGLQGEMLPFACIMAIKVLSLHGIRICDLRTHDGADFASHLPPPPFSKGHDPRQVHGSAARSNHGQHLVSAGP